VVTPAVEQVAEQNQATIAAAQTAAKPASRAPAARAKPVVKATAKPTPAKPVAVAVQGDKPAKAEKAAKQEKPAKADKVVKPAKAAKLEAKPEKTRKPKLVRDSFAMPETEYGRIAELKKRMQALGNPVKKSELLRGGIAALAALNDAELKAVMGRVERIKTGRPAK
jgi:hypothetical protein